MKLKDLLACTVAIFVCSSCIKDEAPNAEADILECIFSEEILDDPQLPINVNQPYDEELQAYPIEVKVKPGTDLSQLAPAFELTPGAVISPQSGSVQNFTSPVKYTVTSEDKKWTRTYSLKVKPATLLDIPALFHFEKVKSISDQEKIYYAFYESEEGKDTLLWASGNQGFAWTGAGTVPNDYPTTQSEEGMSGKCLKLETKLTGGLGEAVKKPIASGNLFMGNFNMKVAISTPLEATQFGVAFKYKPTLLAGYYKYKAGPKFYENGSYTDKKDMFNLYAIFYKRTNDTPWLDGYIAANNYSHNNMVALALIDNPHETNEWTRFEIPFDYARYGKEINEADLKAGKYNISIIMASSRDGDIFQGAPGSTLLVDEIELKYE